MGELARALRGYDGDTPPRDITLRRLCAAAREIGYTVEDVLATRALSQPPSAWTAAEYRLLERLPGAMWCAAAIAAVEQGDEYGESMRVRKFLDHAAGGLERKRAMTAAQTRGRRAQAASAPNPVRDRLLAHYAELLASGKTEREARSIVRTRAELGKYDPLKKTGTAPTASTINRWVQGAK